MRQMAIGTVLELPIRNMLSMSMGVCSAGLALALVDVFNGGRITSDFGKILKEMPKAVKNIGKLLSSV